jgi:CheY-like chemotaxis protein
MTNAKNILLVDDDREILRGASMRLKAAGYRTLSAQDGRDGVIAAIDHHPDAIVLDVRMPRMDGLSALRELRQREATRHIPVVMLSASLIDQKEALEGGARFFVRKPYQGQELIAAVQTAMDEANNPRGPSRAPQPERPASSSHRNQPLERLR